jgi:hypothetical protein
MRSSSSPSPSQVICPLLSPQGRPRDRDDSYSVSFARLVVTRSQGHRDVKGCINFVCVIPAGIVTTRSCIRLGGHIFSVLPVFELLQVRGSLPVGIAIGYGLEFESR